MNVQAPLRLLIPVVLLGALAMTLHGFAQMPWPASIPFASRGLVQLAAFLVGSQIVILVGCRVTGRPPWMTVSLCALVLAAAAGAVWPLLWAALCALAFVAVGDLLIELVRWPQDRSERPVIVPLAVGSVAFGSALELVGSLPVAHPAIWLIAIALPLVVRRRAVLHIIQESLNTRFRHGMSDGWLGIGECIAGSLVLLYFVTALFPEGMHDALVFHLAIPAEVALNGQWHYDFLNLAPAMLPKHANWLYSIGYMHGGEPCARLMNAGYIVASGLAIFSLTQLGTPGRGTAYALLAFGLYLSTPLTYTEASCLFVESVWNFYTLTSLLVLLASRGFRDSTWAPIIVIVALLCGTWATKPQGLITSATLALVMIPLLARHFTSISLGRACACAGAASLIGLAPYLRSWLVTGNPVFPFFNGVFRAPGFAPHNFDDIRWHAPVDWSLLYDLQFHTSRFIEGAAGAAGFHWLLLVPAAALSLIASRNRIGIVLILSAALSFGAMLVFSRYLRYVFPSLSICTAAIAIGLSCMALPWRRIAFALGVTCIAANGLFIVSASRYRDFPLATVFSPSARESYLRTQVPLRAAVNAVNAANAESAPTMFFSEPFGADLRSRALYTNWYNPRVESALKSVKSEEDLRRLLDSEEVGYAILESGYPPPNIQEWILTLSDPIAQFGLVQVLKIDRAKCASADAIADPGFMGEGEDWVRVGTGPCNQGSGVLVTVSRHAVQKIRARSDEGFTLTVEASSVDGHGLARAQIEWLSSAGQTIRVDGESFNVTAHPTQHVLRGTAPHGSRWARVYATGHIDEVPVCIRQIQLRWDSRVGGSAEPR